jgi:hypothetical protein
MYAGYGDGHICDACGETIDRTQGEYEATYDDGRAYRLHLACAGLWEVEQRRLSASEPPSEPRNVRATRDRVDLLSQEAEAVIQESLTFNR